LIVDLHSHTSASDGLYAPSSLLQRAVDQGVNILAITDHDTVDAIPLALEHAKTLPLKLIQGIEITCYVGPTEIHVLGLGLHHDAPGFREWLSTLCEVRRDRLVKMAAVLKTHGIELDLSKVLTPGRIGSVGRPHIARLLIEGGHARNMDDAFNKWLSPGRPAFVDRMRLPAEEAIRWIHDAGGIAVQAHPGQMGRDEDIPKLIAMGLDGLEVFHPDHNYVMKSRYARMTDELGLIATGGSDFHSNEEHHGAALGARGTPQNHWDEIERRTAG
jgi:predicted metal-dependent phosphoesterase TrpH